MSLTNTPINYNTIKTYGDLKKALPPTGSGRVPGINQLCKKANIVIHSETESGTIEIYDNGFYTYEECGKLTVFGVDRCERPETYAYSGKRETGMGNPDFSPYPWELILESAGTARLAHNEESREESYSEISIDAPESENNIALSVKPEYETREEEEEMVEWREARIKRMQAVLDKLTEKQRMIMILDRVEKLTQEQIAEYIGISRRTLREHLEAIEKKLNKYMENTRQ